ncbi:NAD-dependent epimerase/dehydratase family protein [Staphylococcus xylosus]|uniref:NAD-dependent epimerase/dehydratase family protein n=1 Tax=Staphylococcus xylosus TaxID=1288 RepID=UPI002DBD10FF|nr:NAD-dependent epimerase/dehydratase family protein [Staphylococcus xylosus]MEB6274416.1 NAD-dependent epimerase/dehydratase family protein [Staphylococcus xylosus]
MKILITGGAGFIGSHIAEFYFNKNYEVYILDNLATGKRDNVNFINDEHFFSECITNKGFINRLVEDQQFDIVVHLAAVVNVVDTINDPIKSHEVNIKGTLNILEANRQCNKNLKKLIFASSAAVYGNTNSLPKIVKSFINPESPYAIEKYAGEQYAKIYSKLYGLPTTVLRFFNIFGERQDPSSPYSGVISIMHKQFINNGKFTFYGDGEQTRDFVYVKDLVQAIDIVINNSKTNGKIYNLGTGEQVSLLNLFNYFTSIFNKSIDYDFEKERDGDIKYSYAEIDGLKSLGYSPEYDIKSGLKKYVKSYE